MSSLVTSLPINGTGRSGFGRSSCPYLLECGGSVWQIAGDFSSTRFCQQDAADRLPFSAIGELRGSDSGRIPIYQTVSEDAFWEDRHPQALPSYGKDTPFGGCAGTYAPATVLPNSGQRL
jgi:hypothetical protein